MQLTPYAEGRILGGREGPVGRLVINNPESLNAIGLDMWRAATGVLDRLAGDEEVRLLVISGAGGKAFASGADITEFDANRSNAEQSQHYAIVSGGFYRKLESFPKPTIAKINGYCIGGGLALALCCDIRICEDTSRFAIPAAKLGLGYGADSFARLVRVVGTSMAAEILFTARQFSSGEACDMGLVNRTLPAEELDAFVDDYCGRMAQNAPLTVALAKACKIAADAGTLEADRERLEAMAEACFSSADYEEGRRAFRDKRKPHFEGR